MVAIKITGFKEKGWSIDQSCMLSGKLYHRPDMLTPSVLIHFLKPLKVLLTLFLVF